MTTSSKVYADFLVIVAKERYKGEENTKYAPRELMNDASLGTVVGHKKKSAMYNEYSAIVYPYQSIWDPEVIYNLAEI